MKIVKYLFIPFIAIALVFSGCSKSEEAERTNTV